MATSDSVKHTRDSRIAIQPNYSPYIAFWEYRPYSWELIGLLDFARLTVQDLIATMSSPHRRVWGIQEIELIVISRIGRWTLEHLPEVTRLCSEAMPKGSGCNCDDCRNFMAMGNTLFPPEFIRIADLLGIDPEKPVELSHYDQEGRPSQVLVGGFYHIVGTVLSGRDAMKQTSETSWEYDLEMLTKEFKFGFTKKVALVSPVFLDKQVVQLEFIHRVSWVLKTPNPQSPAPNPLDA